MKIPFLIMKNASRRPLRTFLTVLGLALAVMSFTIIRTSVEAWYAGAEASSPNRLVTRHAVSLTFMLPIAYQEKIKSIEGVKGVAAVTWFGGVYVDPKNFFAQFAIDHNKYFDIAPEIIVPPDQMEAFRSERNAAIVGRKLADRFGWEIGDAVTLTGTIFPGDWEFVIRGIYTAGKEVTPEDMWYHRWDYVDETLRQNSPGRAGYVGMFFFEIDDASRAAAISEEVDDYFANSQAETLTETEEAFNLSWVAMASEIIAGLKLISILVIGIILLVLGNTMAMTARERVSEYAVMKTLGFGPVHLIGLIFGESLLIGVIGGLFGLLVSVPAFFLIRAALSNVFPLFSIQAVTLLLAVLASMIVGILAAVFPALKAIRTPIVDGLRILE
jgi:putative ABC transport system permease protein